MAKEFNFSLGTLTQKADFVIHLWSRDTEKFTLRGYDAACRNDFVEKLSVFRKLLPDDYWLGQQMLKTDAKKKAQVELYDSLVDLRNRCKRALGKQSAEFESLHFKGMTSRHSARLVAQSKHVCTACREMLDKLTVRKITAATVEDLESLTEQLEDAMNQQQLTMSTRKTKAIERENQANELYSWISEICEAGKDIWKDENEARYKDYVISEKPKKQASETVQKTLGNITSLTSPFSEN